MFQDSSKSPLDGTQTHAIEHKTNAIKPISLLVKLDHRRYKPLYGVFQSCFDGLHEPFRVIPKHVIDIRRTQFWQWFMLCIPSRTIARVVVIPLQAEDKTLKSWRKNLSEMTHYCDRIDKGNAETQRVVWCWRSKIKFDDQLECHSISHELTLPDYPYQSALSILKVYLRT